MNNVQPGPIDIDTSTEDRRPGGHQPVVPAICCNDELFELPAVLAGKALGQLAGVTAALYIRSGQLAPVLVEHMPDYASYFVYFGGRTSPPARALIDLTVQRLGEKDLQRGGRRERTGKSKSTTRPAHPAD